MMNTKSYADVPNAFVNGEPASASEVNENFQALDLGIATQTTRVSILESTVDALDITSLEGEVGAHTAKISSLETAVANLGTNISDRFNYSYNKISLPAGSKFTVLDVEYEIALFEVASLLDHSIYTVKIPVDIRYSSKYTSHPNYGLSISIYGESNYIGSVSPNSLIDNYSAVMNYSTTVKYSSDDLNSSSSKKVEFDADGALDRSTIYPTYATVYKNNFSVRCQSPDIDLSFLPNNLSHATIDHATNLMDMWYNDGTPWSNDIVIPSTYDDIVSSCINSDSYYKQEYAISTNLYISATIHLDDDTQFSISMSHLLENDIAAIDTVGNERNFSSAINIETDVPNPAEKDVYRQQMFNLFNHIEITKQ
jgi:hypothetical protein